MLKNYISKYMTKELSLGTMHQMKKFGKIVNTSK